MLGRRFKIGTFFDIGLYIHWSFFLLPLWIVGYAAFAGDSSNTEVGFLLALVMVGFTCVILHEYGHALAAQAFGIGTRDITMLPIGGVARLERMPREPIQEIIVAVAGPAVNVVIAIALAVGILATSGMDFFSEENWFAKRLLLMNVILVVFNMVPAFPMDGGRVFRALVALATDYRQATWIAMRVGQIMAIGLGGLGLYLGSPFMPFIAAFVFWVGTMEYRQVDISSRTKDMCVADAMIREFKVVASDSLVIDLATLAANVEQLDFPVVDAVGYRGIVRHNALVQAVARPVDRRSVSTIMDIDAQTVFQDDLLEDVLPMLGGREGYVPVLDGITGSVVGLLAAESCMQRIQLRQRVDDDPKQNARSSDTFDEASLPEGDSVAVTSGE